MWISWTPCPSWFIDSMVLLSKSLFQLIDDSIQCWLHKVLLKVIFTLKSHVLTSIFSWQMYSAKMTISKFSTSGLLGFFPLSEGNELFAAINSSVLPILMATIHTLNHCLHYFNINPLSNTPLIQWHAVNQMHTVRTALRLYWSCSNVVFQSPDFMASFRANLQHDTQKLSHRIQFSMQRSLVAWSSQTHRWLP